MKPYHVAVLSAVVILLSAVSVGAADAPATHPPLDPAPASAGWCLTGNAPRALAARNRPAPGACYTFHDAYTDAEFFPTQPGSWEKEFTAGWVPLNKGMLTDDKSTGAPYLRWAHYWIGQNGIDVVFDLKKDYRVRRVEVECYRPDRLYLKHLALYLKSDGEPRYVMTQENYDPYDPDLKIDEKTGLPEGWPRYAYAFDNVNASSRWVRIHCDFRGWFDLTEVRIWGDEAPAAAAAPKRAAGRGKEVIAQPKELPLNLPDEAAVIFPVPQQIKLTDKDFALTPDTVILFGPGNSDRAKTTAEVLQQEIKRETGMELRTAPVPTPAARFIVVHYTTAGELVAGPHRVSAAKPGPEGYALAVSPENVVVAGSDGTGAFYGTQSLLQLLKRTAQGWAFRGCEVMDWPACHIRYVEGRRAVDEDLIRALARLKINYYHLYNISAAAKTAPLVPLAEKYGVKLVCPMEPRFLLGSHPELMELNPGEDGSKLERSRVNFCPSNPKTWELYFAEVDKWLPVFNSDYMSIGFDEMYQSASGARWNVCDRCRARNMHSHELLAWTLNHLAEHFAKYNKKLYMLDTCFYGPSISYKEDTDKDWRKALDNMPKNILMGVWHPAQVNALLAEKGFPQVRWVNSATGKRAEHFPEMGIPGAKYEGMVINMLDGPFAYSRLVGLSQVTWSPNRYYPEDEIGSLAIDHAMPMVRHILDKAVSPVAEALPEQFFPIDLSAAANRSFTDDAPCDGKGWVDLGPNLDLRCIQPGRRTLGGVPFTIVDEKKNDRRGFLMVQSWGETDRTQPNRAEFAVGRKAAALVFLHSLEDRAGTAYLRKNEHAGYYIMVYEDGTYAKMDIKWDINANPWLIGPRDKDGNLPPVSALKRGWTAWRGETRGGQLACLTAAEWINPRPSQTIVKVIVQAAWKMSPMSPMLVACTGIAPRGDEPDVKGNWPKASALDPNPPVGKPIDLTGGREESWTKYIAPDGTLLEGSPIERIETGYHPGTHPFVGSVAVALAGGNHFYQPKGNSGTLEVTFPEPRMLTGVLLHGPTRIERKIEDFGPSQLICSITVSADGEKWTPAGGARLNFAEELGPQFVKFPATPVKKVRFNCNGLSLVRFYQP